ncbi:MAG TPA: hypothetical protein VD902_01530 [Symbiobacteriaceae bacterium]|nr:hypothetical protein [Symbiobacteriaceae bacterium]
MKRVAVMFMAVLLLMTAAIGTALAAERAVPLKDSGTFTADTQSTLPGDAGAVKQALAERSTVRYRILIVDDVAGESREAYLDRVLAAWGWPPADTLQLVIFTQANYDLYFAMGADFAKAGMGVPDMLKQIHEVYLPDVRNGDPALGLAKLIRALNARMMPAAGLTPEQVVRSFYGWHLGMFSHTDRAFSGNTLAERSYRQSPYLTAGYISEVDATLAQMDATGGGADPFLCAQNHPEEMSFETSAVHGDTATVYAYTHWTGSKKQLTVTLRQVAGQWQIERIACQK